VFIFPVTRGSVVTCRGYKHTSVTISHVLSLSVPRGERERHIMRVKTEYKWIQVNTFYL
jgi:hypothetical protein